MEFDPVDTEFCPHTMEVPPATEPPKLPPYCWQMN